MRNVEDDIEAVGEEKKYTHTHYDVWYYVLVCFVWMCEGLLFLANCTRIMQYVNIMYKTDENLV